MAGVNGSPCSTIYVVVVAVFVVVVVVVEGVTVFVIYFFLFIVKHYKRYVGVNGRGKSRSDHRAPTHSPNVIKIKGQKTTH